MSVKIVWLLVSLLVGMLAGYILKDQLTEEYESDVWIHKPKARRGGVLNLDQAVEIKAKHKKKPFFQRLRERIQARRERKNKG